MKLLAAYKYLFYRTYLWQRGMFGKDDVPEFTALVANSLVVFLNLATLTVGFQFFTGIRLELNKVHSIIAILVLFTINFFVLIFKGKTKQILKEFSPETKGQRKVRTYLCWIYVLLSYLFFLVMVIMLDPRRNV